MGGRDLKTEAIVLRRTKYGEADRIVNFLTPLGRKSAIVRGARKEKSKLAGGIEMFCLSDITLHERSNPDADSLAILTSARTKRFYNNILSSFDRLELGSEILKQISRAADNFDSPELFSLADECLAALNLNDSSLSCINTYFTLNLATIRGDTVNFLVDTAGDKLAADRSYSWDGFSLAFTPDDGGIYNSDHIKLLRLMLASPIMTTLRVQNLDTMLPELISISNSFK